MTPVESTRWGALYAAIVLLLVAVGARVGLAVSPPTREAWTVVGIANDMSVLYARLSTSNTGLLGRQVTSRVAALQVHGFAIEHRAVLGPAVPLGDRHERGIASGSDALQAEDGRWRLQIAGDDVQVRAKVVSPDAGTCPPPIGAMSGVLGVGDGGSASTAMVLGGNAAIVHTVARGNVEGTATYVLGPGFAAGIDPLADCPAWVVTRTAQWSGEATTIDDAADPTYRLGDWTLTVRRLEDAVRMEAFGHTLWVERLLARAMGVREPVVRVQRASVRVDGPGEAGPRPGVRIERGFQK